MVAVRRRLTTAPTRSSQVWNTTSTRSSPSAVGGAWNINEKMRLNVSYFCSLYSDYKKGPLFNYQGSPYTGTETYSRTNHVIGVGLDYKF